MSLEVVLWMDTILHYPRHHGKPLFVGIYRDHIILGFLRWCRMSSIHSMLLIPASSRGLDLELSLQEHRLAVRLSTCPRAKQCEGNKSSKLGVLQPQNHCPNHSASNALWRCHEIHSCFVFAGGSSLGPDGYSTNMPLIRSPEPWMAEFVRRTLPF